MAQPSADIGLIGLAVMGENLVLNMESHGYTVAVFNRTTSKVDEFVDGRGKGKKLVGCHNVKDLVASLKRPRKIMIMVKAGGAGRRGDRRAGPAARARRHPHRRRQHPLSRHHPPDQGPQGKGLAVRRHRRLGRRGRGLERAVDHARRRTPTRGSRSSRSSRRSPPRSTTEPLAATGSATKGPATTSRWSTTASSTATSSSSARPTTS